MLHIDTNAQFRAIKQSGTQMCWNSQVLFTVH